MHFEAASLSVFACTLHIGYTHTHTHTFPKVLGHLLLMKGLATLVIISMSTNLNVEAYIDILGNCVLLIVYQQFGQNSFLF